MNGKHLRCERIGEILEDEGNQLTVDFFAMVIAEKPGEQHLGPSKQIIAEKYDMPIDKQIYFSIFN